MSYNEDFCAAAEKRALQQRFDNLLLLFRGASYAPSFQSPLFDAKYGTRMRRLVDRFFWEGPHAATNPSSFEREMSRVADVYGLKYTAPTNFFVEERALATRLHKLATRIAEGGDVTDSDRNDLRELMTHLETFISPILKG